MRKPLLCVGLLAVASLASTASAYSYRNVEMHGVLCHAASPQDSILYSAYGVQNSSSTNTARVNCGAESAAHGSVARVLVWFYDRHISYDVSCTVRVQTLNGSQIYGATQKSRGASSAPQSFQFDPPPGTYGMVHLDCTIPPVAGGSYSYLTSYHVVNEMP